jgi:antitoxin PrlF
MADYEARMSSKGQITIPAAVRDRFELQAGDIVDFYLDEDSRTVRILARNKSILDLAGRLDAFRPADGHTVTLGEMDPAIGEHLAEKHDRISREWDEWREFQDWKRTRDAMRS